MDRKRKKEEGGGEKGEHTSLCFLFREFCLCSPLFSFLYLAKAISLFFTNDA